jgi:hypothetical protein
LSAATGSFAGSLSAASGTFSGTLTANAINAVNTINIAGNAVTIPSSAYAAAATGYSDGGTLLQSVSFTSSGAPVYVSGFHMASGDANNAGVTTRIYRDGILVSSTGTSGTTNSIHTGTISFTETPGAGYHTYEMYGYAKGGLVSSTNRSLMCLEMKR